jgi:hypothetical protein
MMTRAGGIQEREVSSIFRKIASDELYKQWLQNLSENEQAAI